MIVAVTGVSRSGKGILAAGLAAALQQLGLPATTVCQVNYSLEIRLLVVPATAVADTTAATRLPQDDFARHELVAELVASGVAADSAAGWEQTGATDWAALAAAVQAAGGGRGETVVVVEGFRVLAPPGRDGRCVLQFATCRLIGAWHSADYR